MMDETAYHKLVAKTFRTVEDALAEVDPDVIEVSSTGDVVTLLFANGVRCILNTQRPTRQLWLAAKASAWHFAWDDAGGKWLDDKGRGVELLAQLSAIVKEQAGKDVAFR